jgi:hypothetical protein
MTEILLSLTPLNWIAIGREGKSNVILRAPADEFAEYGDTLLNRQFGPERLRADRA